MSVHPGLESYKCGKRRRPGKSFSSLKSWEQIFWPMKWYGEGMLGVSELNSKQSLGGITDFE